MTAYDEALAAERTRLAGFRSAGPTATPAAAAPTDTTKQFAESLARLQSINPGAAKELLRKYGADYAPGELRAAGLEAPEGKGGFLAKFGRVAKGGLAGGLEILGRPGQASLEAIQAVAHTTGFDTFNNGTAVDQGEQGYGDIFKALKGSKESINLREAIGAQKAEGKLAGFLDTVGSIAVDPTTYVTFGTGAAAKQGLKVAGEELGAKIATQGTKALTTAERSALREALVLTGESAKKGGEHFAAKTLEALDKGGQGGFKFLGQTVVKGGTVGKGLSKVPGLSAATAEALAASEHPFAKALGKAIAPVTSPLTSPVRSWFNDAFKTRMDIVKSSFGKEGAEKAADALSTRNATRDLITKDFDVRVRAAAGKAGVSDEHARRILDGLDIGGSVEDVAASFKKEGLDIPEKLIRELDAQRIEFNNMMTDEKILGIHSAEDLKAFREAAHTKAADDLTASAQKEVSTAQGVASAARKRADEAASHFKASKETLQAEAERSGRSVTFAEGQRLGRMEERAARAEALAAKSERLLREGEKAAPGVREAAYTKAVDDAMRNIPKAHRTAEEAAHQAEKANTKLANYQDMLSDRLASGQAITEHQMRTLGALEGHLKGLDNFARAAAKGSDTVIARANRALRGAAGAAEKAADTSPLVKASERARLLAGKAHAAAYEARRAIEDAADLGAGDISRGAGKHLGVLEERARVALREAKAKEAALTRVSARTEKAIAETIPGKAAKLAERAVKSEVKKNKYLMDVNNYVWGSLTPEGKKALDSLEGRTKVSGAFKVSPSEVSSAFGQGGALKSRNPLLAGLSHSASNEKMAEILGDSLARGDKFFKDNPIELTLGRGANAVRAVTEARYISALSEIVDDAGHAAVLVGKDAEAQAKKLGYQKIGGKAVDNVYAHPAFVREIERANAVLYSDKALGEWRKFIDKWGSLWAGYATTPIIFGTGFFARNAMGNVFNNFLAGVNDPRLYLRAQKAQHGISKAINETGRAIGPDFDAALVRHLGEKEAKIVQAARDKGVLSEGFFSQDMARNTADALGGAKRKGRLNPLNKDNILLKPGQHLNNAIEQNARMAHFFGIVDKTGDFTTAARSVKKYLFDYSDLTAFEKNQMRSYVRFYTYARKNTPLQFAELAHNPGKYTTLAHIHEGAAGQADGEGFLPQYAINAGGIPIGKNLISVDTPFSAALKQVQPVLQTLAAVPGLKQLLPKELQAEGGIKEISRGFVGVPSGGPIELLKAAVEEATGKSLLTGAPVKDTTGGRQGHAARFATAVMPLFSKGMSLKNIIENGDNKDKARLRLLTTVVGAQVVPLDEKTQKGEALRQLSLVKDALAKLGAEGVKVPTVEELRLAGIMPKERKYRKPKAKQKSEAQRRSEAILAVKKAGISLPTKAPAPQR
jgi:hypothetical protein